MRASYILVLLFILSIGISSYSQTYNTHDFGVWTGLSLKTKLNKKSKISGKIQQRFEENSTQPASTIVQIGADYKVFKNAKTHLNLRHSFKYEKFSDRLDLRFSYKEKIIKRTWINGTFKTQFDKDSDSDTFDKTVRFKWEIEHKIKKRKLYPSIANEWFYEINESEHLFTGYRINIALTFDLPNKQTLNIGYTHNQDLNKSFPQTEHIIGAFYSLTL